MNRRVIGVIIAIVGIIVVALGIFSIRQILLTVLTPSVAPTPQTPETEEVLVATRNLAVGDLINRDDVRLADMPVGLIPVNAVRDVDDITDKFVKVPLVSGEIILDHHLADPTNIAHDMGFIMREDMVMMAFPANDLISNLNVLQRGDLVDIFVSLKQTVEVVAAAENGETAPTEPGLALDEEPETASRTFTFDAMQATDISAVIADITYDEGELAAVPLGSEAEIIASREPTPSKVRVRAYLLILDPQDALLLKHLIDIGGTFDLVLRAPTSDQLFDLQTIMSEYLIDRYQLEVQR